MYLVIMLFSGGRFSECVICEFNIYGLECKMINYDYNLSYIFMYSIDMWIKLDCLLSFYSESCKVWKYCLYKVIFDNIKYRGKFF